ncbi:MAG: hypothetical protein HZB26_00605 [Candidatus Hydrogenedentes bacterium]|nr:hypothetical protein [Candidatus Hydrogenedentota bacterium]
MSNRAHLSRTKFIGDHDGASWGWRMGDDTFRSYTDACEEHEVPTGPLELLAKAAGEATPEEQTFLDNQLSFGQGISINGSWRTIEEIAPVLRAALVGGD